MAQSNPLMKELLDVWASVVAMAWEDDAVKDQLLANPTEALEKLGYSFYNEKGEKLTINIGAPSEDPNTITLPFPDKPDTLGKIEVEGAHPGMFT